jgi:hypothetical protein
MDSSVRVPCGHLAREASEDAGTSLISYAKKWDGMHKARSDREWHITWEILAPTLEPYLQAVPRLGCAAGASIDCVDVGCGVSDLGLELCRAHRLRTLWLLDASPVCISHLQTRHAAVKSPSIVAQVADCRSLPCQEHSVRILLDKGTLDAMESDADARAMLVDMARVLDPDGIMVSVSFPAVKRLAFLDATLPALGLMHHTFICPSRDMPAAVVFLSIIFRMPAASNSAGSMPAYSPDDRTQRMLRRASRGGSLYEDDDDFLPPDAWLAPS